MSKYARYFAKIKDLPVYLVIVDVHSKTGWYLFLQPILSKNQSWKHKGQITIHVPSTNLITDHTGFLQDIEQAKDWIRARYPAAIPNAIEAERQRLIRLDPRFNPKLSYKDNRLEVMMIPNEPVKLRLCVKGPDATIRFHDLIEKGKPAAFKSSEISFDGSKLFDEFNVSTIELKPNYFESTLVFSNADAIDKSTRRSADYRASVVLGSKQISFRSKADGSPLSLEVVHNADEKVAPKLTFTIDPSVWEDIPMSGLPHLSTTKNLFALFREKGVCHIHFFKDGNVILTSPLNCDEEMMVNAIHSYLSDLETVQVICRQHGIDPKLSLDAFNSIRADFAWYLELVRHGSCSFPCPEIEISGQLKPFSKENLRAVKKDGCNFRQLRLSSEFQINLFGAIISLGRIVQEFSEMKAVIGSTKREKGKVGGKKASNESVAFKFTGSKNCINSYRFANDGE